jgi:hypothetical protein
MPRSHVSSAMLSLVPWFLAVSLVLGEDVSVSAQEATPPPVEVTMETTPVSAEPRAGAIGGGSAPSAMPSAGVGSGFAAGGTGPLSLGALVGAGVATVFALRERFKNR